MKLGPAGAIEHDDRATEETPVRRAIRMTLDTMQQRARLHRNLVVAVVLVALTALLTSVVVWSLMGLLALLLLLPVIGLFIWRDICTVSAWQRRVLQLWHQDQLQVTAFAAALKAYPHLPPRSRDAMLASLAGSSDPRSWDTLEPGQRAKLLGLLEQNRRRMQRRCLLGTLALSLAAGSLVLSILLSSLGWFMAALVWGVLWFSLRRAGSRG